MLTLLYESARDEEQDVLEDAASRHGIDLVRVPRGALARVVLPCLARGGVIVLVRDDSEASRALGLGVDEVVRSGHVSTDLLDAAINRARTRAEARIVREAFVRKTSGEDDGIALRLLGRALSHEINNPLQALVLDVESLASGITQMLDLNVFLMNSALKNASETERRRLRERLRDIPEPADFEDILDNMRECLQRAAHAMHRFGALTYDASDQASVAKIACELVEILREDVSAELSIEVRGDCLVAVSRPTLVCVLGALLAHALEGPTEDRRAAEIHLRVLEEEGVVLVELEHTGISIPADLRPNVFQPYFGRRKASLPPTGLQGIRERARRWGGDFLMITEKDATTFRLIIPRAENAVEDDVLESVPRLRLEDYDD